ncbi:protein DOG1-like 4 [Rhodamnia argentea]|uniref:Protein DOG1-like 4 n=1 Tax=Rhodamnia argentea TaxID=178133 RepID=A0A8B8MX55_9MYRT|nr:protein DOG1-like 4 [Rhodamnia argentea]
MSSGFDRFYGVWLEQLRQQVDQLAAAPKPPTTADHHQQLHHLVTKFMNHYADYYRTKALAADRDVLAVLAAPWITALERSLHWIGGWRPTTVFHLVYTESSILFEARIIDILRGFRTGDLGDLSPSQFRGVSELQCDTVREENVITEEMSEWQDGVSDLMAASLDLEGKIGKLGEIVKKADELRLKTVRRVVELLTPQQAVEFLISASELQFGIRGWGLSLSNCPR